MDDVIQIWVSHSFPRKLIIKCGLVSSKNIILNRSVD